MTPTPQQERQIAEAWKASPWNGGREGIEPFRAGVLSQLARVEALEKELAAQLAERTGDQAVLNAVELGDNCAGHIKTVEDLAEYAVELDKAHAATKARITALSAQVVALREWLSDELEAFNRVRAVLGGDLPEKVSRAAKLLSLTAESFAGKCVVEADRLAELETAEQRLKWLHTCGIEGQSDKDPEGYEWGIYRVKWDEHGKLVDVQQTFSDMSDLDAAMAAKEEKA